METKTVICDVCHRPILCGKIAEIKDDIDTSIMHECCYILATGGNMNAITGEYDDIEICDGLSECVDFEPTEEELKETPTS